MTTFGFHQQHALSTGRVCQLCNHINNHPDARFHPDGHLEKAQVVQDLPEYYYRGDIILLYDTFPSTLFIEVKVETRTSFDTPNLAVEMYSDVDKKKLGGPFNTQAEWYTHLFADGLLCCVQLTYDVRCVLWRMQRGCRLVNAQNEGWRSQVMLLDRNRLRYALADNYFETKVDKH